MKGESREWQEVRRLNCPPATIGWEETACFSVQRGCVLDHDWWPAGQEHCSLQPGQSCCQGMEEVVPKHMQSWGPYRPCLLPCAASALLLLTLGTMETGERVAMRVGFFHFFYPAVEPRFLFQLKSPRKWDSFNVKSGCRQRLNLIAFRNRLLHVLMFGALCVCGKGAATQAGCTGDPISRL